MFTVYVLYSPSFNTIYIGYSFDIENRFLYHNHLATKGYTIKYGPWVIAYTEEFETKTEEKNNLNQQTAENTSGIL